MGFIQFLEDELPWTPYTMSPLISRSHSYVFYEITLKFMSMSHSYQLGLVTSNIKILKPL